MTPFNEAPDSKFAFVVIAARRARQLMSGAPPMLNQPRAHKPTRVAMEELRQGVLEYTFPDAAEGGDEKEAKRRKS